MGQRVYLPHLHTQWRNSSKGHHVHHLEWAWLFLVMPHPLPLVGQLWVLECVFHRLLRRRGCLGNWQQPRHTSAEWKDVSCLILLKFITIIYLFPVVCDGDPVGGDVKTFWGEGAPHQVTPLLKKLNKDFSDFSVKYYWIVYVCMHS